MTSLRSSSAQPPFKERAADFLARLALRSPVLERFLQAGTRSSALSRLGLGAVAMGYQRVLKAPAYRVAQMDGYSFYVNVGEPLGIDPYFFKRSGTAWITRSLVRPGDVCVDAGANAGHYTFLLASIVGPTGRVYAFEPNPEFVRLMARSITLNGFQDRIEIIQAALSSSAAEGVEFHVSDQLSNSGTSSLVDHGFFIAGSHSIRVRTMTLDGLMERVGLKRLRLAKIDVERAEDAVLRGASKLLASDRIDYLIVEMHRGGEAEALLIGAGYVGHLLVHQQQQLRPIDVVEQGQFGDYLFCRPRLLPARR